MKKLLASVFTLTMAFAANSQNSLLQNPVTETIPSEFSKIEVIDNGRDAALVAASDSGELYFIDINDNDPNDKEDNTITSVEGILGDIRGLTGYDDVEIEDLTVNPITHSIYIRVHDWRADWYGLLKLSNGNLEQLNSTQTFSKINPQTIDGSSINRVEDITWGNNTLYVSSRYFGGLGGILSRISAPFNHNTTISEYNNTACHTHFADWMGEETYYTTAPLERLAFGNINGENRLMGTFTCAPGYSFEPSELSWDGTTAEIKEMWNANNGRTLGLAFQTQNGNPYLFELHQGMMENNDLIRIGETFIDGSPEERNEVNLNRKYIRNNGEVFTDEEIKITSVPYTQMVKWSECEVLVLEEIEGATWRDPSTYNLEVVETASCATLSNKKVKKDNLSVNLNYNKSNKALEVSLNSNNVLNAKNEILIYNLTGNLVLRQDLNNNTTVIKTNNLKRGTYITVVNSNNENKYTSKVFLK